MKKIFKANRILSTKEKAMILEAYQTGFEEGYRVGSKETTELVKYYCNIKNGVLANETKIEEFSNGIRIYGEMIEGGKRFLEELEVKK